MTEGDAASEELQYVEIDVGRFVRSTCAVFDALAEQRSIRFSVTGPKDLPAQADVNKLERIVLNLLFNAFKLTPVGGLVACTFAQRNGQLVLDVLDSGPRVPEGMREAIFDRKRQLDRNVILSTGGTGLGLGISRHLARLLGGSLSVADGPAGGPLFRLVLPVAAPAGVHVQRAAPPRSGLAEQVVAQAAAELRIEATLDHEPPMVPGRALVLVVDDSRAINRLLSEALRREYNTVSAFDGAEGLRLALGLRPDLVLTDVVMPGMSGGDLVKAIHSDPLLRNTAILVLTASDDEQLRIQLLEEGAQDFVAKPFMLEEVRARVGNLVASKRARDLLSAEVANKDAGLAEMAADVTRHKRELATALEQMRVAREVAERANLTKSNFLRMVSHEMRTPVTAMHLHIHMLEMQGSKALDKEQQHALTRIKRSYRRLLHLVDGIIAYARIESGRLTLVPQPFDLAEAVSGVVDEITAQAEQKGVHLALSPVETLPPLDSDRALVRLIALNVIGHVVDSSQSGTVEVQVQYDSAHRLAVANRTLTLSAREREELFEPLGATRDLRWTPGFGSGLGLAIVKELIGALGGYIAATTGSAGGTRLTVTLPDATKNQPPPPDASAAG